MDPVVRQRLERTHPWLAAGRAASPEPGDAAAARSVPRLQLDPASLRVPDRVHLLEGPAAAGKRTLVEELLRGFRRPLRIDLSEPSLRRWCGSAARVRADLASPGVAPDGLALVEAQHHPDILRFARELVADRPGIPVLVTGRTALTPAPGSTGGGWLDRHRLLGFSMAELELAHDGVGAVFDRDHALSRLLRFGGLPGVHLAAEPAAALGELVQRGLAAELADRSRVKHGEAFLGLLEECARRVGVLVNHSELAERLDVSVGTVQRYLGLLAEAHLLALAPCYAGGRRREVTSASKAFLLDNGVRNALLGRLAVESAERAERHADLVTWAFGELTKLLPNAQPVRFWRSLSGADVDFVVDPPGSLLAVEMRLEPLARRRISRAARSFAAAYAPDELWVVNDRFEAEGRLGETVVRWIPHAALPAHVRRFASAVWVGAHRRDQARRSR